MISKYISKTFEDMLLSHAQSQENEVTESEMIASMLTAIRSFINDWVDKNEKYQEINTIEYGGSKIILEASGYSYLAVIANGSVSQNVINNIHEVLSTLVSKYAKEIKDKITYLLMLLNSKDGNKIEYSYEYPNLHINGTVINSKNKAFIIEQFKMIEGLKEVKFNIEVVPSNIDEIIHFDQNSAEISQDQEYKLISIINTLKNLDDDLVLEVKGFRDPTGTNERNIILVKQRAENIMKYLKLKGNVSQK